MTSERNYIVNSSTEKKVRILCIGDIILDKFISGSVDRVSPEAPIPVLNIDSQKFILGGAGNVVANISALEASSEIISTIGNDEEGQIINSHLRNLGNVKIKVFVDKNKSTTTKIRYVAGGQHLLRVDNENIKDIDKTISNKVANYIEKQIHKFDVVVLSDYGKGTLTKNLTKKIISFAKKNKIPIIVDPNGRDYSKYVGCSVITPNKLELSLASNMNCKNDHEINRAAKKIQVKNKIDSVLITRSEEGMTLIQSSKKVVNLTSEAKEIFDVSGAGDTVVAVLATELAFGRDIVNAAKISNYAAGIVIGKIGTSTVSKAELKNYIGLRESKNNQRRILEIEEALSLIENWKENKLSIGFTNGAFDLIHEGHLSSLKYCKRNCNKLIVGINSDLSVKKLKGTGRPINKQEFRSEILSSLEFVDIVIIFNESNPLSLIKKVKPDFIFKGSDYSKNSVIGRNFVESYGGKVLLTPFKKGKSSTNIIQKIKLGK